MVVGKTAGEDPVISPAAGRGVYPDHDPAAEPAGHQAEVFGGSLVIGVEPGCARDRLSRADDEHEQRVVLFKGNNTDRQG